MDTFYFYYLLSGNNTPIQKDTIVLFLTTKYLRVNRNECFPYLFNLQFNNFVHQSIPTNNVYIINYVFILDDYAYAYYIL